MKRSTRPIILTVMMLSCLSFGQCAAYAEQQVQSQQPLADAEQIDIYGYSGKDLSQIIDDMFDVLYQSRNATLNVVPNDIVKWIRILDRYEEENPGDIQKVLFLQAECYYRLNDFKEAYAKFYQYKLNLESTDDPFYYIVEDRMASLSKYIQLTELTSETRASIPYFEHVFAAIFILLLLGIIFFDTKSLKKRGQRKEHYGTSILPPARIIDLEEMCRQDGRCSYDTVMQYKNLSKEKRASLVEQKKEKFEYAQLVVEGHEMIHRVNKKTPRPVKLILLVPKKLSDLLDRFSGKNAHTRNNAGTQRLNWSPYWLYPIFGTGFTLLLWLVTHGTDMPDLTAAVTYVLLAAFVISCLAGIHIMAAKTIDAIDEFVCMFEPDPALKSIKHLEIWIERLFNNPRQYYFFIIVMAIIVFRAYSNGRLIIPETGFNIAILLYAVMVWLASVLIWFMLGSLVMMNKVYDLKDLSINPLSPSKTIGLEKWISVIGTYNMVCSIVLTFGCAIPIYRNYMTGGNVISSFFWFFIISPILIFNWIYPYIKIGSLVKSKKTKRMNFIKTKISILFNEWVDSENRILKYMENTKDMDARYAQTIDRTLSEKKKIRENLDDMESYYQVFKKIEESPESYFDLNSALELAKVLGFPSLFAILSAAFSYVLS